MTLTGRKSTYEESFKRYSASESFAKCLFNLLNVHDSSVVKKEDSFIHNFYCLDIQQRWSWRFFICQNCNLQFFQVEYWVVDLKILEKCPNFTFGHRLETPVLKHFSSLCHNCNFLNDNWHFGVKRFTQFRHTTNAFNGLFAMCFLSLLWSIMGIL